MKQASGPGAAPVFDALALAQQGMGADQEVGDDPAALAAAVAEATLHVAGADGGRFLDGVETDAELVEGIHEGLTGVEQGLHLGHDRLADHDLALAQRLGERLRRGVAMLGITREHVDQHGGVDSDHASSPGAG